MTFSEAPPGTNSGVPTCSSPLLRLGFTESWNIPSLPFNLSSSFGWVGGGITDSTKSLSLLAHSHFSAQLYALHPVSLRAPVRVKHRLGFGSFKQNMTTMLGNEVFSCFVFYGVLLVLKMYAIAIITGQVRLRKKVSHSDLRGSWKISLFSAA